MKTLRKARSNEGFRTNPKVIAELRRIAKRCGGLLLPEEVLKSAESKGSLLHGLFCWDDTEAARLYRLCQARQIIRTTVHYIEIEGDRRAIRTFVSLTPDREEEFGGYRETAAVLSDKSMRDQLLLDALQELSTFERKYLHLKELEKVFIASRRVREQCKC